MRQTLHRRLQLLELQGARVRALREQESRQADVEGTIRRVRLFLRIRGIEQTPAESLMEALAHALEIRPRDLRGQFLAEIDPIYKYFTDHGVFEEIKKRKAAGTWPSGEKEWESARA
jgi:hypothetical protein